MKWKNVVGYEEIYLVSEYGDVKRIAKTNNQYGIGHILKHSINKGYANVQLHKNGIVKQMRVHRIVSMAFIENPNNKPHVNHIDGNKLNNHISNLEWCTPRENEIHKHRVLGKTPRKYIITSTQISGIKALREEGKRLHQIANVYNLPIDSIHKVLKNEGMKTGYGGMYNGRSKLTDSQRNDIINLRNKGEGYNELAKLYSVSLNTIKRVLGYYKYEKTR